MNSQEFKLIGLRGATTSSSNSVEAMESAVTELVQELIIRNGLRADQIVSITFTVTSDLNCCFPAAIARQQKGWEHVALLDCQQMAVANDLKMCIRILAHAWIPQQNQPQHPYLRGATKLRPDRSQLN